jgi:UDP-glucose 4-epimerase
MRIVVTGASGNVGSALLRRLGQGGQHEIVGVVRRPPEDVGAYPAVDWVTADLSRADSDATLRAAFTGADAVVHLVWAFQPTHREDYLAEVGVGGTRRVIAAVMDAGVPHLVHMSSVGAYSPRRDDRLVDEGWPTQGVPTSVYSRHKAAAERLLDRLETEAPDLLVSRMRPGIVGQGSAGSALLRYALPALLPATLLDHLPLLPLDRSLTIPMVHADDVADALARVVEARVPGPFNLAAEPAVTAEAIARVLDARLVHVPASVVRSAVSLSWHARLQPLDAGWIDLAYSVPLMDTTRAASELGWQPTMDAVAVLTETVAGMRAGSADQTPLLRPRSVPAAVRHFLRSGPVTRRRLP